MIRSRWIDALLWLLVLPFTVWAVLRISGWTPTWHWVSLVAFTPYVAAASVLPLILTLVLRRRAVALTAFVTTIAFASVVMPRLLPDGNPSAHGARLRVLSVNLAVGQADVTAVMKLVRAVRPDVLTVQEITPQAAGNLDRAGLRTLLPHVVDRSSLDLPGSGIHARYPLTELPMIEIGGFRQARATLQHPSGQRVEVVSVHPCSPSDVHDTPCWADGLKALPRAGGVLKVLAGDFNSTLDHRPLRDLLGSGYRDAADARGKALIPTWPQRWWNVPGVTLDHVLADRRMAVEDFSVHSLPGTDHRAVFAALRLP
ncbi:endonuclease/exonuclease/phosphatase family protein [Actinomadura rudentiformis]|uniref:Endonuclease/exonuclease/phosphatase family protein n=1 Tax=Actinomadura rudentiformis TaxID=359158 RepID=A0A6H9YKV7_9ACTN|nr:endonuclease/exonuclease/phosphatase family protein [Actinomadura rudentiformis]KAB2346987.1 endonuclease/exonuclease/phosphatase family protein [Actinomadura rudentiformis]